MHTFDIRDLKNHYAYTYRLQVRTTPTGSHNLSCLVVTTCTCTCKFLKLIFIFSTLDLNIDSFCRKTENNFYLAALFQVNIIMCIYLIKNYKESLHVVQKVISVF